MTDARGSATPPDDDRDTEVTSDKGSLLAIVYAPVIWAFHFVTIYALSAVTCVQAPQLFADRITWIAAATVAAIGGILLVSRPAFREWRRETDIETDHDSVEGRSHFLAHAAILLSGLSLYAILLQTIPFLLGSNCR